MSQFGADAGRQRERNELNEKKERLLLKGAMDMQVGLLLRILTAFTAAGKKRKAFPHLMIASPYTRGYC
ncbi:uncharacterized protein N7506_007779 [Penicillium brevicompactum]|uniref:uncharacterized protein n=1 Tax=Penicillium brevicompactum TaxID=5074 RepID=UPI00253FC9F5|nr:uncharacterized protein N7506_007779 [Penicillium brevicompactum]KAJ5333996.1 hypothetical protein N7506_007779 [Penicillium brevicompactum]